MTVRIIHGDCREVLQTLEAESVDAICTDPPYGINFMGREWDAFSPAVVRRREAQRDRKGTERASERWPGRSGTKDPGGVAVEYDESASGNQRFQAWCESWSVECLRVLKPGGHMVACGGPRTFHRLTAGIEDAGFEIRDVLSWLFGSGFPKSHNLPGGIGTALKPAWEPIVLARKPLVGTVAANVEQHGTGALNIDACRIGETTETHASGPRHERNGFIKGFVGGTETEHHNHGRWPANVCLDESAAAALDASVPVSVSRSGSPRASALPGNGWGMTTTGAEYDDAGGPSRFFYTSKSSRAERNRGLEGMPERLPHDPELNGRAWDIPGSHSTVRANHHPTVKPVSLCRWLVRLVTPPAGLVVDIFAGSGTTGVACVYEERDVVLIEKEAEYIPIIRARIERAQGPMFANVEVS